MPLSSAGDKGLPVGMSIVFPRECDAAAIVGDHDIVLCLCLADKSAHQAAAQTAIGQAFRSTA